jgi:hypothetical protein
VSDVVVPDVGTTLTFLRDSVDRRVQKMGGRLQEHLDAGRLAVVDDPFWTSPLPLWDMPDRVAGAMRDHDLTVLKGDANYRRMLGDRHWPYTTPLAEAAGYVPAPTLALRTMKAEVAVGLSQSDMNRAAAHGADWSVNGEWGLIQLATPTGGEQ